MDFDSLAKYLAANNIAFSDIQTLKEAIQHDSIPTESNKLGENVSGWIATMIGSYNEVSGRAGNAPAGVSSNQQRQNHVEPDKLYSISCASGHAGGRPCADSHLEQ